MQNKEILFCAKKKIKYNKVARFHVKTLILFHFAEHDQNVVGVESVRGFGW